MQLERYDTGACSPYFCLCMLSFTKIHILVINTRVMSLLCVKNAIGMKNRALLDSAQIRQLQSNNANIHTCGDTDTILVDSI